MTGKVQHRSYGRLISGIRLQAAGAALGLAMVVVPGLVTTPSAQAQTLRVLYSFKGGTDGSGPWGGLIRDAAGNFYGTTSGNAPNSSGTVFILDRTTGKETPLYDFTGQTDGGFSQASLLMDATHNLLGTLYGTTVFGGDLSCGGCGTVFSVDRWTGKETVLHAFTGGTDGSEPICTLVEDARGNLYGTTAGGGNSASCAIPPGCGTVFKLDTTGKETVLYSFNGGTDGGLPQAGVIRDEAGNLYGTALIGAYSAGVVFKLDTAGTETVLYSFTGGTDGANPAAGLVRDAAGNLYGTTESGGAANAGTVFKLDTTGTETVLHTFTGGMDGANPYAGLLQGAAGSLYGTALYGGDLSCGFGIGCGVVFGIKP
jgi:uncharacterized repeat protein (TIGR03803 family)